MIRQRPAVQAWLARFLAFAFVLSGGLTIVGSSVGAFDPAPVSGSGAHSLPLQPASVDAVGIADAVSGSVAASGLSTQKRPDAGAATRLSPPRPTLERPQTTLVPAANGALAGPSTLSRAPPPE